MKNIAIWFLSIFDYFHKKKIADSLNILFKNRKLNTVFDVGAHRGETVFFFVKRFEVKSIFAFEPLEKNYSYLKKNISNINNKNSKTKINIFNFALGEKNQKKIMKEMLETSSSTFRNINKETKYYRRKNFFLYFNFNRSKNTYSEKKVSMKKGDSFVLEKEISSIDLLKIDTEGYELQVLYGLRKTLKNVKAILFEHHYHNMLVKEYKFTDIHSLLIKEKFILMKKYKMPFRKAFEYIYINKKFIKNNKEHKPLK